MSSADKYEEAKKVFCLAINDFVVKLASDPGAADLYRRFANAGHWTTYEDAAAAFDRVLRSAGSDTEIAAKAFLDSNTLMVRGDFVGAFGPDLGGALKTYARAVGYNKRYRDFMGGGSTCLHDFPDTGMRRSWCRHCDAEGVMGDNFAYEVVVRAG